MNKAVVFKNVALFDFAELFEQLFELDVSCRRRNIAHVDLNAGRRRTRRSGCARFRLCLGVCIIIAIAIIVIVTRIVVVTVAVISVLVVL